MEQPCEYSQPLRNAPTSLAWRKRAFAALLIILVFVVFSNTLSNEFVFDDISTIKNNPAIRNAKYVGLYFTRPFFSVGQPVTGPVVYDYYRPMVLVSYLTDYLVWNLTPFGYHLTNIFLHAVAAVLVFLLLGKLGLRTASAFIGAALFAVHPTLADSVAGISGRSDPLCAIFFLASIYWYIGASQRKSGTPLLFVSYGALILALLTKENAIAIPAILTVYEFVQRDRDIRGTLRAKAISLLPTYLIACVYFLWRARIVPGFGSIQGDHIELARGMATAAKVVVSYLCMMFFPHGLSFETFTPIVNSVFEPAAIGASVIFFCLLAAAALTTRRAPRVSFSIFWFLACQLPYFYFFLFIPEPSFFTPPHFLYFSSVGLAVLCGLVVENLARFPRVKESLWRRSALVFLPIMIILFLYSVQTVKRNKDWRDELTFFSKMAVNAPQSPRTHIGLANALMNSDQPGKALAEYGKAYELARSEPDKETTAEQAPSPKLQGKGRLIIANYYAAAALTGMGDAYRMMGEPLNAIDSYKLALGQNAFDSTIHLKIARTYESTGYFDDAIASYERALKLDKNLKEAATSLQLAIVKKKAYEQAKSVYLGALSSRQQDSPEALYGEAVMLRLSGKEEAAIGLLGKVIEKEPLHYGANLALGRFHLKQGEYEAALGNLSAAFAAQPTSAIAAHELALTTLALGDTLTAVMWASKAYELDPSTYYEMSMEDIKSRAAQNNEKR